MPRVLYGVSPIGLGHATRSLMVVRELEKKGAEVRVFSGGKAAEFMTSQGVRVDDQVNDATPWVVGGEMKGAAAWYARSWLAQRRNLKRARALIRSWSPDLVVCDEEFSGVVAAGEAGVRRVFIADELSLGFARGWLAGRIERRVQAWYSSLMEAVDLLIVPEDGVDEGNRRHVGPIVRPPSASCREVRERFGIQDRPMVLVSLSGSGLGRELASKAAEAVSRMGEGAPQLVVTGNRGPKFPSVGVLDLGVVGDNQDLVCCADLVVSTAGKSTIDEAASCGTPIIAIPIKNHAEQERNAAALGYSNGDSERLGGLILQKIGRRGPSQKFNGERRASQLILSAL